MSGCRRLALVMFGIGLSALALSIAARLLAWPLGGVGSGSLVGIGVGGVFAGVLLWFTPGDTIDSAPPALRRRYFRDFIPPMAAYVVVMLVWRRLLGLVDAGWLRLLVALLPAALILLVMRAVARYVRDADEMQRRIELESIGVAAGVTGGGYMTAGFLQIAGLIQAPATSAMLMVFPALCLSYGIARLFVVRRYA